MRIRWTPPAVADLQSINDYLKQHHPDYRQRTMRTLYEKIRALKDTPYIGRPGCVEGTRELLFPPMPYIAVYRVHEQTHRDLAHLPYGAGPAIDRVKTPHGGQALSQTYQMVSTDKNP